MFVIAVGNFRDGVTLYGPYNTSEEASALAESTLPHADWFIIALKKLED